MTVFTKMPNMLGISDFRAALAANLAKTKKGPLFISDRKGGEGYVVLNTDSYNELFSLWEDHKDGLELERLIKASTGKKRVSWEKIRDASHK